MCVFVCCSMIDSTSDFTQGGTGRIIVNDWIFVGPYAYPPILIVIRVGRERAFSICYSTVAATNWGEMTNEEQNAG